MLALWNEPIKNENQIIVRSKQPIKIEKPFQGLLTFSHSAGEKNILRSVLLLFFSVFISSMPSKVILIVIEIMFLGINMFWALLRVILARAAKMSLSRTQNIFYMPANINSIVILVICTNTPWSWYTNPVKWWSENDSSKKYASKRFPGKYNT